MAKDLLNAAGSFGEAFFKTLQSERERQDKLRLQEKEFSQRVRETNLLDAYRNKSLELQGRQPFETKTGEVYPSEGGIPNFGKPLWMPPAQAEGIEREITDYTDPNNPIIFGVTDSGKKIELGKGKPYNPREGSTTVKITNPAAPYTPTKDLEQDWNTYQSLDELGKNWESIPEDKRSIVNNKGEVIPYKSKDDIKRAKDELFKNIKIESDDRAKKINEEYIGFGSIYRDLMRDPNFKRAVKEGRGDAELFRAMEGFPEEAINEMKNLIYKRIF